MKLFGIDLGPEEYLERAEWLPQPGETTQDDVDARLDARLSKLGPRPPGDFYTPGNIQNLYMRLALTEPTKDGIMDFAETFGDLGLSQHYAMLGIEPLSMWVDQILKMSLLFRLWRAIKRDDEQALYAISKEDGIHWANNAKLGTLRWAWELIAIETSVELSIFPVEPNICLSPDATGLQVRYRPISLISLLWAQFAAVVTSGNRWNICQYCAEPFEVRRKGQKACSESHRQMAYRKRKQSEK